MYIIDGMKSECRLRVCKSSASYLNAIFYSSESLESSTRREYRASLLASSLLLLTSGR